MLGEAEVAELLGEALTELLGEADGVGEVVSAQAGMLTVPDMQAIARPAAALDASLSACLTTCPLVSSELENTLPVAEGQTTVSALPWGYDSPSHHGVQRWLCSCARAVGRHAPRSDIHPRVGADWG